uniref:low-density lipoprotein receptor-related protein 2-like isoform X2 n=1 Tax=Doryrhamphus excisus TaxID=161450 RepID=UPI0025AE48DD|nr:low-density lipoprotein receptor-related protein 2-like isoform X2 [Doryrhamphus excisus]
MNSRQLICLIFLSRLKLSTGQNISCRKDQWQCDDGGCIANKWRCDGDGDCLDGSDEMDCVGSLECPPGQFSCMDSVDCVDASARCDGQKQCPTGSDEENCTLSEGCLKSDWTCQNKICIPRDLRCDGQNDCADNSDEEGCGLCSKEGIRCPEWVCLSAEERCDGKFQCSDGSDEPVTCGKTCSVNNGGCSHVCVDEPWGALCACPAGYYLSINGAVCKDVDECALPFGPCMHYCTNTAGSYYCHCREGFTPSDGFACLATGNETRLLTVLRTSAGLLSVKSQRFEVIQTLKSNPVALTYDIARGRYYWADDAGRIYKSDGQRSWTIYTGEVGIKALACDWLNGNLFWANQRTDSIYMQAEDEKSCTTLLSKDISPSELVLIPLESLMFWINTGPKDRVTLEKSWMDGSERSSLAVLTAQLAHGLTADVGARRLYWISDFKKSVETVKVDGTGSYSFTGLWNRRPALNLAVFEGSFYWVDDKGLWQVPQDQLSQRTFLWKSTVPLLSVYHELQQPRGTSACTNTPCHICLLTKGNPLGFTCTCPNSKVLMLGGACEYPRFLYATSSSISMLEFKGSDSTETELFSTDKGILSFDVNWNQDWLYWANQTGHLQRTSLTRVKTEWIQAPVSVCQIKVDQKSGSVYWVSCHQTSIGSVDVGSRHSQQLYRTTKEIRNFYLDWLRGGIIWLEEEQVFTMSVTGSKAKELLRLAGVRGNIAFDIRAASLLWNSKVGGLTTVSLLQEKKHQAGKRWNISGSVVGALEPYLISLFKDAITLWDRRDGRPVQAVTVKGQVVSVMAALGDIHAVPTTVICNTPAMLCRDTSICLAPSQLCDGKEDCPDGDDEDFCVKTCPSKDDFKCQDQRSCVSMALVCDGRSHCFDGSDEVGCPAVDLPVTRVNVLKCRKGFMPCRNGAECVLYNHVCDGEKDCQDGSDEEECEQDVASPKQSTDASIKIAPTTPPPSLPACISPSVLCSHPSGHLCITPKQFCDGQKDCPDGFDEENCVKRCPSKDDFRCKDRRNCISTSLVCDGRAHCHDGSDEVDCPSVASPAGQSKALKCLMGSRLCRDGSECVLFSHVCDGEADCKDGSDEEGCDNSTTTTTTSPENLYRNGAPSTFDTLPPSEPSCQSPSFLCSDSSCILPTQICDGIKDCPDGLDENCIKQCPNKLDFLCKDRRSCVSKSLVCDGRSHCHDGSDEVNCPTVAPPRAMGKVLKCRLGFRLCRDQSECVLFSHVCDGERDCADGSDEDECGATETPLLAGNPDVNKLPPSVTVFITPSPKPSCRSPSVLCPNSLLCISPTQLCDGIKDCPDGSDENCIKRCPNKLDFLCKDRRSCVSKSLVCDGRSHCHDGSDEVNCPTVAPPRALGKVLKCRLGFRPCQDQSECVLFSHVCDGERDCADGSDEDECDATETPPLAQNPSLNKLASSVNVFNTPTSLKPSCGSPSVLCPNSLLCISPTQLCDGIKDCPDGSDENCIKRCPNKLDFLCKDRRSCVSKSLVCDGRSHCHDGSDEVNCPTVAPPRALGKVLKCRLGFRSCRDQSECVLFSHVCDGERDCADGSDEDECATESPSSVENPSLNQLPSSVKPLNPLSPKTSCRSPSVLCPNSFICISPTQLCDGIKDCPDGSDENCMTKCIYESDFLCKDRRSCVSKTLVCDGRAHCQDGSDEVDCPSVASRSNAQMTNALKCRTGSKLCKDGTECVLYSHVCDGEKDCLDGSDEEGCQETCKQGEFQCAHGAMCIPEAQVCDGTAQCRDRSDELDCWEQTKSCQYRCADGHRCIPKKFLCDGELDCLDGTDEAGCDPVNTTSTPLDLTSESVCIAPSVRCPGSSVCISPNQLCDRKTDCPDAFDESDCIFKCKSRTDFLCRDRRKCIPRIYVCDGRAHCPDGSDERQCKSADPSPPASMKKIGATSPLKCRKGFKPCKNGLECVMYSHVCDGEDDCQDGSDEESCAAQCKSDEFECQHGNRCIAPEKVCDGQYDCRDRSDEMNCESQSLGCQHRCDKTRCIPATFLCDGERDCVDGSDEEKCGLAVCEVEQYRCMSGQCVSEALRCDGYADCSDRSDEVDCARPPRCPTQLRCPHSHECLQREWLCDGEDDCKDGSDEKNCVTKPPPCREYQWQCGGSSQCIPLSWRCDGKKDCHNSIDEDKCSQRRCPSHLYQCGSGECVDLRLVCNGFTNCADSSDEGVGCTQSNCSSTSAPQCEHSCVSTPNGPKCYCTAGFTLHSGGVSCVDTNECNLMQHEACKHSCLNTPGSYGCHCHPGFYLEPDNKSCKTKDEPLLLASVQSELLLLGVHSGTLRLLSSANRPVFSLDYHWARQRVYWLSPDYQSIRWADMTKDSNNKGTLIKGVKSDFIAMDWVGKNLYWVDGLVGQILAVRLSDTVVKSQDYIVVLAEDLEQPRSLVLLPHKGLMLWSEIGSTPQIRRSGMDGSKRKVVVSSGLSWPVSLAYDFLDDRVYWADEKLCCIGSTSLDGDYVKILQLAETPSPFSVAVFNDRLFWSDTKRRTIRSADKNTGKDQKVLLKRPGQPFGLKLMHALSQPTISNPCDQLQCSHLCLLTPMQKGRSGLSRSAGALVGKEPAAVCRCPKGLLLSKDKISCSLPLESTFIVLLSTTRVYQIYLQSLRHDGVGLKSMPNSRVMAVPGVVEASVLDVSIQALSLYLADSGQGTVDVLNLSGPRSRQGLSPAGRVLSLKDDSVVALAVDWVTSNLYWSSTKRPNLHVTTRHNGFTTSLLQGSLTGTTSIAVHPPSSQFCYTALVLTGGKSLNEVSCAWMDGRNKAVLWTKSNIPTSLVFSNNGTIIYWADTGEGLICSIGLNGSGYKQYKTGPGLLTSFTYTENILLWITLEKDVTKMWFSDGLQPKQLWFETQTSLVDIKAYSTDSQEGSNMCGNKNGECAHLCLPYPGGRTCKCSRGFYSITPTSCAPEHPCPDGEQACLDSSKCISSERFCDGRVDCLDQSDEQDCPYLKSHFGKKASDGQPPKSPLSPPHHNSPKDSLSVKDAASCGQQHCHGHGHCITQGKARHCHCIAGYKGEFCEEEESGRSHVAVVLGVFCLLAAFMGLAFIFGKRRAWVSIRGRPQEKETLMANMSLPEHLETDCEELESTVDFRNPPVAS